MIDALGGLLEAFVSISSSPENILVALAGAFIGTFVGVLPGVSPTVAISLLLVPSASLDADAGLILLTSIYFGSQYGDALSAVLMNVPAEAGSVVLAYDGYPMAKAGRAGPALTVAAIGSFIGGVVGLVFLVMIVGELSDFVFSFGPREFALLALLGLLGLALITSASISKAFIAMAIGLMLPTVGLDSGSGLQRFTFGFTNLLQGFSLVPVILGIVGLTELFERVLAPDHETSRIAKQPLGLRSLRPSKSEWRESRGAWARGTGLGFILGLIPGPSLSISSFASYRLERAISKHPERFGKGAIAGVAAPGTSDNAAVSGNLASLVTVGIPFTPVTGVLYAGFLLHGLQPGPLLIRDHPDLLWRFIAALIIGNVALLVMNVPLVALWVRILTIPPSILTAGLALLILLGSFSLRSSYFDMLVTIMAGMLGLLLKRCGIDRTTVIVGLLLGPVLERNVRQTLAASGGDFGAFFVGSISQSLVVLIVIVIVMPPLLRYRSTRRAVKVGGSGRHSASGE